MELLSLPDEVYQMEEDDQGAIKDDKKNEREKLGDSSEKEGQCTHPLTLVLDSNIGDNSSTSCWHEADDGRNLRPSSMYASSHVNQSSAKFQGAGNRFGTATHRAHTTQRRIPPRRNVQKLKSGGDYIYNGNDHDPIFVEPDPIAHGGRIELVNKIENLPKAITNFRRDFLAVLNPSKLIDIHGNATNDDNIDDDDFDMMHDERRTYSLDGDATPSKTPQRAVGQLKDDQQDAEEEGSITSFTDITDTNNPFQMQDTVQPTSRKRKSKKSPENIRIYPYQNDRWKEKYQELREFYECHGHCNVPHIYRDNPPLGQWVKRQRHQYRLHSQGDHSHMNADRIKLLEDLGFVWDSHGETWEVKYRELMEFWKIHGHCTVPTRHNGNPSLSTWIKRQRRQHRLFLAGKPSAINQARISKLEELGFVWDYYNERPDGGGGGEGKDDDGVDHTEKQQR